MPSKDKISGENNENLESQNPNDEIKSDPSTSKNPDNEKLQRALTLYREEQKNFLKSVSVCEDDYLTHDKSGEFTVISPAEGVSKKRQTIRSLLELFQRKEEMEQGVIIDLSEFEKNGENFILQETLNLPPYEKGSIKQEKLILKQFILKLQREELKKEKEKKQKKLTNKTIFLQTKIKLQDIEDQTIKKSFKESDKEYLLKILKKQKPVIYRCLQALATRKPDFAKTCPDLNIISPETKECISKIEIIMGMIDENLSTVSEAMKIIIGDKTTPSLAAFPNYQEDISLIFREFSNILLNKKAPNPQKIIDISTKTHFRLNDTIDPSEKKYKYYQNFISLLEKETSPETFNFIQNTLESGNIYPKNEQEALTGLNAYLYANEIIKNHLESVLKQSEQLDEKTLEKFFPRYITFYLKISSLFTAKNLALIAYLTDDAIKLLNKDLVKGFPRLKTKDILTHFSPQAEMISLSILAKIYRNIKQRASYKNTI